MVRASIIIPAYNEERHIAKCIESLLQQNYSDIEIIIIDNGSKDKTRDIAQSYIEKYPQKIRLIKLSQNMGPGAARNIGAKQASGEILLFLDADMIFPPDYITNLVEPIKRNMAVSTSHSEELVGNLEKRWVKVQGQLKKSPHTGKIGVARAIRKDIFLKYGGFDPTLHYHDDRTFFHKSGIEALVISEAHCYPNNPDTLYEIFRRNYWIGRTYIAITLREKGLKGLLEVARTAIIRLIDLTAIPFAASWLACRLTGITNSLIEALLITPPILFILAIVKMKIVNAPSIKEKIILRSLYAPAYRIVRAAGLIAGLTASLTRGLTVKPKTQPITTLHQHNNTGSPYQHKS